MEAIKVGLLLLKQMKQCHRLRFDAAVGATPPSSTIITLLYIYIYVYTHLFMGEAQYSYL